MTKDFRLRALATLVAALLTGACAGAVATPGAEATAAARVTLTGVASFADDGEAWLVDCANNALRTQVGAMDEGNRRYFRRRVEEIQGREGKPVTAQLSGYLVADGKARVLERPALMWLSAGHCTEPDEPPLEPRK